MKDFLISRLTKKLVVRFSNKEVILPSEIQEKIDTYWDELLKSGKSYKRGEIFTVTKKEEFEDHIEMLVEKTDYAHYLYCQDVSTLGEYGVHIIHTAALVDTTDQKTVLGKMANHTSRAGIYQLCGGGIDNDDLRGDIFDFDHNITKELHEELGIDVKDRQRVKSFELAYFKEGGPTDKMTAVYRVVLNEASSDFIKRYNNFVLQLQKKDEKPEFSEIVLLDKNKGSFAKFFSQQDMKSDECIKPLFEFITKELEEI